MDHTKGIKLERLTSKDSNTDESSDIATNSVTPITLSSSLNPLTQSLMKITQVTLPPCTQEAWKIVEDVRTTLFPLFLHFYHFITSLVFVPIYTILV